METMYLIAYGCQSVTVCKEKFCFLPYCFLCTFVDFIRFSGAATVRYEPLRKKLSGARWLSGKALDSGARGRGLKPTSAIMLP